MLVHGFGASAYHWRYIIPELAKTYSVYAVDLLGFGMSEKPSVVYNGYKIWSNQLTDFIKEVSQSKLKDLFNRFLFDIFCLELDGISSLNNAKHYLFTKDCNHMFARADHTSQRCWRIDHIVEPVRHSSCHQSQAGIAAYHSLYVSGVSCRDKRE